jgi:hypothetical protein
VGRRPGVTAQLTEECGGKLCVKIVVEYDRSGERCRYYGSDPEPDSIFTYRNNMTVRIG